MMIITQATIEAVPVGKKFGKWEVLGPPTIRRPYTMSWCRCECGVEKWVTCGALIREESRSCGCQVSQLRTIHGGVGTKIYALWHHIKDRCSNPNIKDYKNYGGRGITVCQEWKDNFSAFRDWAYANGYIEGLQIDRENNDGNYSPENCRFITNKANSRNRRSSVFVTAFGKKQCLRAWAEDPLCVVGRTTFEYRLRAGWEPERALTTPSRQYSTLPLIEDSTLTPGAAITRDYT